MVELSALTQKTIETIATMPTDVRFVHMPPDVPDVVDIDLIHGLVGATERANSVITELVQTGHAVEIDPQHIRLINVLGPAADDEPRGIDAFISWHIARTTMADKIIQPCGQRYSTLYSRPEQHFESAEHAMSWFGKHATFLFGVMTSLFHERWYGVAVQLAEPLWSLYRAAGKHHDALATQTRSLLAVEHLADDQQAIPRAVIHARTAYTLSSLRRHHEAVLEAQHAVDLAGRTNSPESLVTAWSAHGRAVQFAGKPLAALKSYRRALVFAEQIEDTRSGALLHRRLGEALILIDGLKAIDHLRIAADLMETVGDSVGHARVLTVLGRARVEHGECEAAATLVEPTLAVLEKSGRALYEAEALQVLGAAAEGFREPAARDYYVRAVERYQSCGEPERAGHMRSRLAALGHV